MKHYRSSIPREARELVTATFAWSPGKYKAEYLLKRKIVGVRYFHETGELADEIPLKDGLRHGPVYRSDTPGKLLSCAPYANGLPHGTAKQWSEDGKLMGSYRMKLGTGTDLWWCSSFGSGRPYLSEARHVKGGKWHGFDWWLNEDQKSVWQERHFHNNLLHGIERQWNSRVKI